MWSVGNWGWDERPTTFYKLTCLRKAGPDPLRSETRRTVLDSRELLTVVGEGVRYESDRRSYRYEAQNEHRTLGSVRGATRTSNFQSLSTVGRRESFSGTRMRERKVCRGGKLLLATRVHRIAIDKLFEQV